MKFEAMWDISKTVLCVFFFFFLNTVCFGICYALE